MLGKMLYAVHFIMFFENFFAVLIIKKGKICQNPNNKTALSPGIRIGYKSHAWKCFIFLIPVPVPTGTYRM